MGWSNQARVMARQVYALRKHNLNADLHIHCLENPEAGTEGDLNQQAIYLRSICGAAVMKGLDIIGIVSHFSFEPGNICQHIIGEHDYDLHVMAGVEIKTAEGIPTIVYDAHTVPKNGEPIEQICQRAHQEGGSVMVIQPSKRNMQHLNKIAGQPISPDFIEMFNDMSRGGYAHTFVDVEASPEYHLVVNSAATNPQELDRSVMMTRIPRDFLTERGILVENQGVNYTPPYLENVRKQMPGQPTPTTQPGIPMLQGGL